LDCSEDGHSTVLRYIGIYYQSKRFNIQLVTLFCTWCCQPERGWEADTTHLRDQIDSGTVAVVVNNPSNPCGSVYSREHLTAILEVARTKFVPIIADEIYEHMVSSCPAV
jgi:Aspartate/tyrosine/aromatic aminotransferase